MRLKLMSHIAAATALVAAPVAVSAQPVANPAASLSVAKSVRAGASTKHGDKLAGGGVILAVVIAAGIAAIVGFAIANDNNSDSN